MAFGRAAEGRTGLAEFYQSGCLKARLPRPAQSHEAELVLINTAGGLTGGDCVSVHVSVGEGALASVTTSASERIYRSVEGEAIVEQHLRVGRGARLDWIPQETIVFNRGRLRRRLGIELDAGAEITVAEAVLFGRRAMQETVYTGLFCDFWTIRRNGKLIFADATRLAGPIDSIAANAATLGGHAAMASLAYVGRHPEAKRDALRTAFGEVTDTIAAGTSLVGDVLVARIVAPAGHALREVLIPALASLREGRPLPRLWSC